MTLGVLLLTVLRLVLGDRVLALELGIDELLLRLRVGDFTTLLASVNPTLADDGYPRTWTQYTVPVAGLGPTNVSGCIAFRYFITDTGNNGETIGIDSVSFTDNASTACTTAQASAASAQATVTSATATMSLNPTLVSVENDR